jgi:hypothetical protein
MERLSIMGTALGLFVASSAMGQAAAAPATPSNEFKLNLAENFGYYGFDGSTEGLAAFNTSLSLDLSDAFSVSVAVPVYNQGSNTNIGDVTLSANADAISGEGTLLGVFSNWSVDVHGGVDIPTETVFSSSNVNPFFGAEFSADVADSLAFSQSVDYKFVGSEAFVPLLGNFTDSDILNFGSNLSWWFTKELSVAADFVQQYYVDSSEYQLLLGPSTKWHVTKNININAGVLLPISQSVNGSDNDYVVTAGVGIEF